VVATAPVIGSYATAVANQIGPEEFPLGEQPSIQDVLSYRGDARVERAIADESVAVEVFRELPSDV
jgi:hypothetical protein